MIINKIIKEINSGMLLISGKRLSFKTSLAIYILNNKISNFKNTYYLFSNFYDIILYLNFFKKNKEKINFINLNNLEDLKDFLIKIYIEESKNNLIIIDNISTIIRIANEESIVLYRKLMSLFFITYIIIKKLKSLFIITYTNGNSDKILNIIKYWCDIIIIIEKENNNVNFIVERKDIEKRFKENLNINDLKKYLYE